MNSSILKLYQKLPASLRSVAASSRGLYLRRWRYGPETDGLVEEALERESWSASRWRTWQEERLAFVLHRAATRVPYYSEQWARRRRGGDRASFQHLENWPVLEKETLRSQPLSFIADDCEPRRMFHERTSGTTGTPLELWWSRQTVRAWFALFDARTRVWNGVSRKDPWAILGGQPVIGPAARRPPFWVVNAPMKQLYLSANHISPQTAAAYIEAIRRHGATHLVAYPSSASVLAREAHKLGLRPPGLRVAIANAEPVFPWQRDVIAEGLGCRVQETYGMAEIAAAGSQCESGTMHDWPEVGRWEIEHDPDDASGGSGRLISTGLLNPDMPLIRYAVGDRVRVAKDGLPCDCGRTLPPIGRIEGRTNDLLIARDGRRVYWLNPVFYGTPVREAQIVQKSVDQVSVRYVPAPQFSEQSRLLIAERLRGRLGDIDVLFESFERIPRDANGKFRAVICLLPDQGGGSFRAGSEAT